MARHKKNPNQLTLDLFPRATIRRIKEQAKIEQITPHDYVRRVVYNSLPRRYHLTLDTVLPAGKYEGETIAAIIKMDPEHIRTMLRVKTGIYTADDEIIRMLYPQSDDEPVNEVAASSAPQSTYVRRSRYESWDDLLRTGEYVVMPERVCGKVFAKKSGHFFTGGCRFLGRTTD